MNLLFQALVVLSAVVGIQSVPSACICSTYFLEPVYTSTVYLTYLTFAFRLSWDPAKRVEFHSWRNY